MFSKVLVANRGEIAARIVRALREMNVASVAVYSEADAEAPHVINADEAYCIGPPPVSESYLQAERILDVAASADAEAIHPGYGLLSENAAFARQCVSRGMSFIGPSPEVIEMMGDKIAARRTAMDAGVPVVPGSEGPIGSGLEASDLAERIGYPVLVKAAGGGGGIGMALVKKPSKLERAIESCRDRGRSSFGNDAVYIEKYIENPRHIEVQVLFDHHGHGVHLFERECSLQRRHQKVIEEAPSPFVSRRPEIREALCDAAHSLAAAVGYCNAGTVEFVMGEEGRFYFIEMNTRLQVEHPVTEAITGVDLVQEQVRIAAGHHLEIRQSDLKIEGAAIECRLYAEEPEKMFLPRPGQVERFERPALEGIRWDVGINAGQEVTSHYDPMVAKLIAHGPTRDEARNQAIKALGGCIIEPLTHNVNFLTRVLDHAHFRAGQFDTNWLERFAKGKL